jgi:TetR/AcrR family transcriptional repressor of nem operon
MSPQPVIQPRGRPREFDIDNALRLAIEVFRQRGYTATSIVELMKGMHLSRGSFYKAFHDKKSVFAAAYDMYAGEGVKRLKIAADVSGTGRDRIAAVLALYAQLSQGPDGQRGCLVIATAVELSLHDPDIARRVVACWQSTETLLCELLRQAEEDGSIAIQEERQSVARSLLCLMQGMRLLGKSALHSQAGFKAIAEQAMKMVD